MALDNIINTKNKDEKNKLLPSWFILFKGCFRNWSELAIVSSDEDLKSKQNNQHG